MTTIDDASRPADMAGIQALLSREPGYSVAAKCLEVQEAQEALDPSLRTEHGRRLHPKARSWYLGALGEQRIGRLLAQLGPEWMVRHSVPIGTKQTDVDHLLIGPSGVYALNTKHHPGAVIWAGDRVIRVDGANTWYVDRALGEAANVQKRLADATGFVTPVTSVLVFVGVAGVTGPRNQAVAPFVLRESELLAWLRARPAAASQTALELVRLEAEMPHTWHIDPDAANTLRVMQRFERLVAAVGPNPAPGSRAQSTQRGARPGGADADLQRHVVPRRPYPVGAPGTSRGARAPRPGRQRSRRQNGFASLLIRFGLVAVVVYFSPQFFPPLWEAVTGTLTTVLVPSAPAPVTGTPPATDTEPAPDPAPPTSP